MEEAGLELLIERHADEPADAIGQHIFRAVESHAGQPRFGDDLTVLILKRRG